MVLCNFYFFLLNAFLKINGFFNLNDKILIMVKFYYKFIKKLSKLSRKRSFLGKSNWKTIYGNLLYDFCYNISTKSKKKLLLQFSVEMKQKTIILKIKSEKHQFRGKYYKSYIKIFCWAKKYFLWFFS